MKKTLNISIIDNNHYFIVGLRQALTDFYLTKGIHVRFIDETPSMFSIDILFHAFHHDVPNNFCYILSHNTSQPFIFAIRDKNESYRTHMLRCVRKDGTLYRHQPVNLVMNMVEQARFIAPQAANSARLLNQIITNREYEVLRYLKQGKNLTEAAYCLNLSVKTVSAHKRSVMKKLNFKRNSELLYWMLKGGG